MSASPSASSRANARRSERIQVSGPPVNTTGGRMVRPRARELMICPATASKIERAMSAGSILRLRRFCTSVLANTPQREAIG